MFGRRLAATLIVVAYALWLNVGPLHAQEPAHPSPAGQGAGSTVAGAETPHALATLQAERTALQAELAEASAGLAAGERLVGNLRAEVARLRDRPAAAIAALQGERDAARAASAALTAELRATRARVAALEAEAGQPSLARTADPDDATLPPAALALEIRLLRRERDAARAEIDRLLDTARDLQRELNLLGPGEEAKAGADDATTPAALAKVRAEAEAERSRLVGARDAAEAGLAAAEARGRVFKTTLADVRQRLAAAERTLLAKEEEVERLRTVSLATAADLKTAQTRATELEARLAEVEVDAAAIARLEKRLSDETRTRESLTDRLVGLEEDLTESRTEAERLRAELARGPAPAVAAVPKEGPEPGLEVERLEASLRQQALRLREAEVGRDKAVERLREQAEAVEAAKAARLSAFAKTQAALETERSVLRAQNRRLRTERQSLQAAARSALDASETAFTAERASFAARIEALEAELRRLKGQKSTLQGLLATKPADPPRPAPR